MASGVPDEVMMNAALIKELADVAKDEALLQGVLMRTKETPNSSELVTYAPFTLFPSPVPKSVFLQALAVQTHFNTMVDKISQDTDFLQEALARLDAARPPIIHEKYLAFCAELWRFWTKLTRGGPCFFSWGRKRKE
ncbi:hypothetical protein ILYODFUR_033063 [Ilyodon furcidens]|uniref:Uncharacterized protein n=1 Tax=Ilyodon furcidens TaxID=33524 RepID=A0ABV0STR6_9TELE